MSWLLIVVVWLLCGVAAAGIYSSKGRSGAVAFLVGLIFGPLGVALALLTPADTSSIERRQLAGGTMKKCPYCGEMIRPEATVCRHCQRELPNAPTAAQLAAGIARKVVVGQAVQCSVCSGFVRDDAERCKHCGAPFV